MSHTELDFAMNSPASSSSSNSSLFDSPSSSSSASSSSSVSVHPSSLVHSSTHSQKTLSLVSLNITDHLIDYVVDQVIDTVDHAMSRPSTLLPASSSSKPTSVPTRPRTPSQQKFSDFASTVITRAEITTPTLLVALVYINRARPFLHIALEAWALERVFLGALIVASKYSNDSTLKNLHWAMCTGVFGKRDVGRIEREFLAVLEWDLGVREDEILALWEGLQWAVELKEREQRQKEIARLEKEKLRQLQLLEQQRRQQKSTSKFFLGSGERSRTSSSPAPTTPPRLPTRPRNHQRSSKQEPPHTVTRIHSHSPASSMSSSSSSPSGTPSPKTPEDVHTQYVMVANGDVDEDHRPRDETPSSKKGLFHMFNRLHHHCSSQQSLPPPPPPKRDSNHLYSYTLNPYATYDAAKHRKYATEGARRPVKRVALKIDH